MSTLEVLQQHLSRKEVAGPAPEIRIADAERQLGLHFPPSYREFLLHFGAAWLSPPFELAGLPPEPPAGQSPLWSDVVQSTMHVRRACGQALPSTLVCVSDNGAGTFYYLDTASINALGEAPVVSVSPASEMVFVADSFADFVALAARGTLA